MTETFDVVVIGAGASGEAAADLVASRGATVALVEKDLVGGSCAYWACMPSKALLHAAAVRAKGGEYPWPKASDFRDYMINRTDRAYPDDSSHARGHERAGVTIVRGTGRLNGRGRVDVTPPEGPVRTLRAKRAVIVAAGSRAKVPPIPGLEEAGYWTNVEATSL
ncbi:MAG TPA: FAD-dependent oxidoreductase, partial [Candidatus Limnocylindria bacterium]